MFYSGILRNITEYSGNYSGYSGAFLPKRSLNFSTPQTGNNIQCGFFCHTHAPNQTKNMSFVFLLMQRCQIYILCWINFQKFRRNNFFSGEKFCPVWDLNRGPCRRQGKMTKNPKKSAKIGNFYSGYSGIFRTIPELAIPVIPEYSGPEYLPP